MPQPSDWSAIARETDPEDVREQILTGYKNGKPFTPYVPTIPLRNAIGSVLDFGCGLGRNFPYLKTVARHVAGFDLPPMIERCRALASQAADALDDDWERVRTEQFDLIFASLVLQHIDPTSCRRYLRDFARMTREIYLLSRDVSDFGPNVFREVAETGMFDVADCVEVEHDSVTHQLRALGGATFSDVSISADGRHFETLLRCRTP